MTVIAKSDSATGEVVDDNPTAHSDAAEEERAPDGCGDEVAPVHSTSSDTVTVVLVVLLPVATAVAGSVAE